MYQRKATRCDTLADSCVAFVEPRAISRWLNFRIRPSVTENGI